MEARVQEAVAEERKKWEKVVEGYNEAEQRYADRYDQVMKLEQQLAEMKRQQRDKDGKMEDEVEGLVNKKLKEQATKYEDELEFLRQESVGKEKAAAARVREMFEKQLRDMEEELRNAKDKISELAGLVNMVSEGATEQANADWLREEVKRERKRTRDAEKQLEPLKKEVEKLKKEVVDAKQAQYKEAMEGIQRENPASVAAYKQLEQAHNENKSLRQQLSARDPNRIFDLEGQLKVGGEEKEKLQKEVKTLQAIIQRQEKALAETQEIDSDCAQKVNNVFSDLQVSKAETVRVREKLEQAEKNLKSRAKIEETLRQRMEAAEKKANSMEKRLKDVRGSGSDLLATIDVDRAAATREELESMRRKATALEQQRDAERKQYEKERKERERMVEQFEAMGELPQEIDRLKRKIQVLEQAREQERKQQAGVLREKDRLVDSLQELSEQQQQELEAKAYQCRALTVQLQDLKAASKIRSPGGTTPKSAAASVAGSESRANGAESRVIGAESRAVYAEAHPPTSPKPKALPLHNTLASAVGDRTDLHSPSSRPCSSRAGSSSSLRRIRTPSGGGGGAGGLERLDDEESGALARSPSGVRRAKSSGGKGGMERLDDAEGGGRGEEGEEGGGEGGGDVEESLGHEL